MPRVSLCRLFQVKFSCERNVCKLKSIKRTMAMCAAATLAFSAMSVMPAIAADDSVTVKVSPSKTDVAAGDEITVVVDLTNCTDGVTGFTFDLTYDDSVIEFVPTEDTKSGLYPYIEVPADEEDPDFYKATVLKNLKKEGKFIFGQVMGPKEATTGKASFVWENSFKNYTQSGDVLEVTFKVKSGAKAGDTVITIENPKFIQCVPESEGGGTKDISATVESATLTVEGAKVPATDLKVTPETIEVFKKDVATAITATVTPADSTDKVTYKSGDTKVATVDATGVVTSVAEGATTITVTAGKLSKEVKVTVHELTKVPAKAATCTAEGNKEYYKCACGKLYEDANGNTETTKDKVTLAKLEHDFTKQDTSEKYLKSKGTCVKKSVYYISCKACGEKGTVTFEDKLDPNNHENLEVKNAVKPDYFVDGYTGDTYCKDCGVLVKKGTVDPMLIPEKVAAKAPTCTEAGNKEYYKGGDKLYTSDDPATAKETTLAEVTIPATGHNYAEPTYEFSADRKTCTAKRVCKNDATHVETETVDVVETVITAATYESEGESKYTATFKNPVFAEQTITEKTAALVHTYEAVNGNQATCTEDGNKPYYIRDDGKLFVDQAGTEETTAEDVRIPATGHDWELDPESVNFNDDFTVCKATLKCKNDGSHVEDIETTDITVTEDVESTCTEGGYTTYLAKFDNGMTAEVTIDKDAAGHTWGDWEVVEEATEEAEGQKKRTCEVCGAEEFETIPAIGSDEPADEPSDDGKKEEKKEEPKTPATNNPVTGAAAAFGLVAAALGSLAVFKKRK